jgi:hypothetical protein
MSRGPAKEAAACFVGGVKQTSEVGDNLQFEASKRETRKFYIEDLGWDGDTFDTVDWEALDLTTKNKPKMFQVWLCKQASRFCATGSQAGRWFGRDFTNCPNCNRKHKCARNLLHCHDDGRTALFHDCVSKLASWLAGPHTDQEFAHLFMRYLQGRGTIQFLDLPHIPQQLHALARQLDSIGWDNVLEGKIPIAIRRVQIEHMAGADSLLTIDSWLRTFISHLLHITHSQWIYRNISLHHH